MNKKNKNFSGATFKECSANGCDGDHWAKGYCQKHYTQVRKYGRLTIKQKK